MKILFFCHRLEIGGTLNCIELASALRDHHGHEVVFFATPGPFLDHVRQRELRFVPAPPARFHPSPGRMRALTDVIQQERPDLLHVWEYYQCLEAFHVAHLLRRVPMSVTSMMMEVVRLLPKGLPTTFGTPQMLDAARAGGRTRAHLLLPPVDVRENSPDAVDGALFKQRYKVDSSDFTIVTVSRLSYREDLKFESIWRTIDAVRALGRELPVRLIVVGDGETRGEFDRLAAEVNSELGRTAVMFVGSMTDPRPAYAAADLVIGMGGSALRGMAFGKPVIIVGTRGFAESFSPASAERFLYQGMFGVGDGRQDNGQLTASIREIACAQNQTRVELGKFGREFVLRHFSIEVVGQGFSRFCDFALANQPGLYRDAIDGLRTLYVWARERRWYT